MADEYLLYSGVSIGNSPIVLGVSNLDPPDNPTSGLLATAADDGNWYNVFTLLPLPLTNNLYLMVHTATGLSVRFSGKQDGQITLTRFQPYDPNFYIQLGGDPVQNLTLSQPNSGRVFTVAGSDVRPGAPVLEDPFVQGTGGQVWQLMPIPHKPTA